MLAVLRAHRATIALLVCAFAVRTWSIGQARFTTDESYFWATARQISRFEAAPVFGPALTGSEAFHPGPLFFYLMSIPQFFGASPWLGGIFIALLHTLAGYFLYAMIAREKSERAALIGLGIFIFAPWDVLYSNRIWLSCVAPVCGTAILYFAQRAHTKARQATLVFLALVCPQLHMSAPIIWVGAAVLLLAERPVVHRKAIALGAGLALLAYSPAIYWDATHHFENITAIMQKSFGDVSLRELWKSPLRAAASTILFGSSDITYHFARGYWTAFDELEAYRKHFDPLALATFLFAAAAWIVERNSKLTRALIFSTGAGMLLILLSRKLWFPHYLNLLMPAALAPIAFFIDRFRARFAIAAAIGLAMAVSTIRFHLEIDRLDGLSATTRMVEYVLTHEREPFGLEFEVFDNTFAWEQLTRFKYRRVLRVDPKAKVFYEVKNGVPYDGRPLREGEQVFGAVVLRRSTR